VWRGILNIENSRCPVSKCHTVASQPYGILPTFTGPNIFAACAEYETCNILLEYSGDLLKPANPSSKMPPSQLKQLKASLRDHGLVGPQKSKKQKKAASKDGGKRLQRNAALEGIRERFNPFEVKAPARPVKFEVTSNKPSKSGPGRPGVTKGLGEERRRETLLKEIHSRVTRYYYSRKPVV